MHLQGLQMTTVTPTAPVQEHGGVPLLWVYAALVAGGWLVLLSLRGGRRRR